MTWESDVFSNLLLIGPKYFVLLLYVTSKFQWTCSLIFPTSRRSFHPDTYELLGYNRYIKVWPWQRCERGKVEVFWSCLVMYPLCQRAAFKTQKPSAEEKFCMELKVLQFDLHFRHYVAKLAVLRVSETCPRCLSIHTTARFPSSLVNLAAFQILIPQLPVLFKPLRRFVFVFLLRSCGGWLTGPERSG